MAEYSLALLEYLEDGWEVTGRGTSESLIEDLDGWYELGEFKLNYRESEIFDGYILETDEKDVELPELNSTFERRNIQHLESGVAYLIVSENSPASKDNLLRSVIGSYLTSGAEIDSERIDKLLEL